LARRERVRILTERIDALLAEARQMDVDVDEIVNLIHQRDAAMDRPTSSPTPVTRKG
jgi:GntR family transcriptional regulator